MSFKASAPGSLMLLGEHAVLHGGQAVVCAINKRISVVLTPRNDKKIRIASALGHYESTVSRLKIIPPFQFVLTALKVFQKKIPTGCDIKIHSEFSEKLGLGSSAAVTVVILKVVSDWLKKPLTNKQMIFLGREVIRKVQGLGSGADIAASVLGGVVAYRLSPEKIQKIKLKMKIPLTVVYSGSKTPTVEVVRHVEKLFQGQKVLFHSLCGAIDHCAAAGVAAMAKNDLRVLGKIMNVQQELMDALGVNTNEIEKIIQDLRNMPRIYGAKISGSGLGDCVIAVGRVPGYTGFVAAEIAETGVV